MEDSNAKFAAREAPILTAGKVVATLTPDRARLAAVDERPSRGTPKIIPLLLMVRRVVPTRNLEVIISTSRINRRFRFVRTLILSVFSLSALALPLSPAKAQCLGVDLGFGCAGLGVGSWYTQPRYYGYPTYYGYP